MYVLLSHLIIVEEFFGEKNVCLSAEMIILEQHLL